MESPSFHKGPFQVHTGYILYDKKYTVDARVTDLGTYGGCQVVVDSSRSSVVTGRERPRGFAASDSAVTYHTWRPGDYKRAGPCGTFLSGWRVAASSP